MLMQYCLYFKLYYKLHCCSDLKIGEAKGELNHVTVSDELLELLLTTKEIATEYDSSMARALAPNGVGHMPIHGVFVKNASLTDELVHLLIGSKKYDTYARRSSATLIFPPMSSVLRSKV